MDLTVPASDKPLDDPQRLAALAATGLMDAAPEKVFDRLTTLVSHVLNAPISMVSLVDDERQFFKSQFGLPEAVAIARETPLSYSLCQHVTTSGQPLIITNAPESDRPVICNNLAVTELGLRAYIGVPLRAPDGHVLGSLCAIDMKPREWSDEDKSRLQDIAAVVESEIQLRGEIEKRVKAESDQQLLIQELHHRVKNTLATVQSIVRMSSRTATDFDSFRESVVRRIHSLSNTHSLLITKGWDMISLKDLMWGELQAYNEGERILMEVPDIQLPATFAIAIGMVVHELTTNASKHGALSSENGRLDIKWTHDETAEGRSLTLAWRERGGPAVEAKEMKRGFGSQLVEALFIKQLGGQIEKNFEPAGLSLTARTLLRA